MKPSIKRATLADAHELVDICVDAILSSDRDAGWHQPSVIALLMEFEGDMPPSSGNSRPDLKMIEEIKWLRRKDPRLPVASMMLNVMDDEIKLAVLYDRLFERRRTDEGHPYSNARVASEAGMNVETFKKRKGIGYHRLIAGIDVYRQMTRSLTV